MKKLVIIVIGILLLGCANPYEKYYFDLTNGVDVTKHPMVILPAEGEKPKIMRGNDVEKDATIMLEDGYIPLGYSYFNDSKDSKSSLIAQAQKVSASVVLVYSKYTHTLSGLTPLVLPDVKTSTTSFSSSVFGSGGGSANLFGSTNTTTYGNQIITLPYNVNRYDIFAGYWIKTKPGVWGLRAKDLPQEIKQKIGSNKGVLVHAVVKGSPAFKADIIRGDIIKKIGAVEIVDEKSTDYAVNLYAGKKVTFLIIRDGKEIIKEVHSNPKP